MKINTIKLNKDKNGKVPYLKTILKEIPTDTVLCKTLTGLGATYGEIKAKRHSIIIEPNVSTIQCKCDEPKQWELREINDIMNNAVTGWRAFSNPRYFPEPYRRQKGWERIRNDNEPDNSMDGFQEIPTEEMEQLGLPEE